MNNEIINKLKHFYANLPVSKVAVLILVGFTFWPNFKIANLINYPYKPIYIPQLTIPGQTLLFPYDKNVSYIRLKTKDLSKVDKLDVYLSGIDINERSNVYLHGQWPYKKKNSIFNFFSHNKIFFFKTLIPVEIKKQKSTNLLRLPASVWKKVNKKHYKQKVLDRVLSRKILSKVEHPLTLGCMKLPIESKIVSQFGAARTLPNGRTYRHTGLDLRARSPQKIYSTLPGLVRYADHMVVPGNNLIIDHGQGLFSRYMHLSQFKTAPGEFISRNRTIAYTGRTGRVEGPHLHWEVIWKNNRINPLFLKEKLKSFCNKLNLKI